MGYREFPQDPRFPAPVYADAAAIVAETIERAMRPRKPLTVSQWADLNRRLSSKGSVEHGRWRTDRNPPLREPMDGMSARSPVRVLAMMFPIQFGKTEVAINTVGYSMDHHPGPIMVCLPGEVSMGKWTQQKLQPMLDETPAVRQVLASSDSRNAANRREFKDFEGGQLYIEHAGSPQRLKSTTVRTLIVDELDEFAAALTGGDDPVEMLEGRTSAFPAQYKRLFISSPQMKGVSRIEAFWEKSDQRRYFVPCPHCGHEQHLQWSGLRWGPGGRDPVYICQECGAAIAEHHKTDMIARGRWIPTNPEGRLRGYHINCLYYQLGLGPRWQEMAEKWLEVQHDPAKLKTFVNERLAETWEDPAMRAVKHNVIAERAEAYPLRQAPHGVLVITAGVDTQDNRLAVQIIGWGRGLRSWVLDYVELPGDPADEAVWASLTQLLNTPISTEGGATLRVEATAIDAGGHRTEAVKHFVRQRRIRRPMCIFGAVPNNAPPLSKGKMEDVTWRGQLDKKGVLIHHVGTVGIKHMLYGQLSTDATKEAPERLCHFSDQLSQSGEQDYFAGLVSETYNPVKNRFDKRRGARNEPLDTWVYAYAAIHHKELRLHRYQAADWARLQTRLDALAEQAQKAGEATAPVHAPGQPAAPDPSAPSAAETRRGAISPAGMGSATFGGGISLANFKRFQK